MALVTKIDRIEKERQSVHQPTTCSCSVIDVQNKRYIQLDTYGSSGRQLQGKVSQSLQLDEDAAAQLKALIAEAFPHLA